MSIEVKHYNQLTLNEFHDLISLRIRVFVIEQNCPYQELDGKDKLSFHLIMRNDSGEIIGTTRILPQNISFPEIGIGRVVIDEKYRYLKLGHALMKESLQFIRTEFPDQNIKLSAQTHLCEFYASHGFVSTGKEYLEDDIPHTEMLLKIK